MRVRLVVVPVALALAATACSDSPAPAASPAHDTTGHAPEPAQHTPYARAVAAIAARGRTGAEQAWAAGRPALLLFAASW